MNIRKISLILAAVLSIFLCSCKDFNDSGDLCSNPAEEVEVLKDSTGTVNGYKTASLEPESSGEYYANISTKKFHLETCRYSKSKKSGNIITSSSREGLIKKGYSPCKICKP